jgi:hypothetical protein
MASVQIGGPLQRGYLDAARTPARVLAGAAFVAYSSIGTILGVHDDLAPALAKRADGAILGYGIGLALAAVIFVAELLLAEASVFWYIVVLIPDTTYTYRFSGWIDTLARAHLAGTNPLIVMLLSTCVTALFSLAVAYFGERMLFGKRR